ncbi:hypothetical protein C7T94_14135 [Pedobacter yulinensis]|uniref:Uncharacterized protein n=1 Tax=Pedobacter yulinensis TaxID=2126353 RepID=A0A2T3HMI6_9SPHI|nr:hypothetical protein [Pedobacter yulinensis]PST83668.1 hypothetical protein C7T94_14135 [Pedobacter yulinensis]
MREQLIARWNVFLGKMRARFTESLTYGEQAVLDALDENGYDYYGAYRVLQAVRAQIYNDLVQKVSETWQQQVEPQMRADGDYWPAESQKGHELSEWMDRQIDLWVFRTEGQLSKKYYAHAIQLVDRNFFCTQCNSPVRIQRDFFMAQYVSCAYCNAINTFEPETKYQTIGWNVVHNIAAFNAFDEYRNMQAARSAGGPGYVQAMRSYYEKYFDERIKLLPHTAATRQRDLEAEIRKHI